MKFFIKLCLLFFFIVACSYEPNSNINSNRLNEIDNLINSFIDDNQIPGAVVLVGDNKNILYQKSLVLKILLQMINIRLMIFLELHL